MLVGVVAILRRMAGKGGWKGKPPTFTHNFNVPGLPKCSIDQLPQRGVAIFKESADQQAEFCEHLKNAVEEHEHGTCKFENIDVSGVTWGVLEFQILMDILMGNGASAVRLKFFKCGLDDECVSLLSSYLESLPAEALPQEIHLSHNQMTRDSFQVLLDLITVKREGLATNVRPVYVRVEENQIEKAYIDELVKEGKVLFVSKLNSPDHNMNRTAAVCMPAYMHGAKMQTAPPQQAWPQPRPWQQSGCWGGGAALGWGAAAGTGVVTGKGSAAKRVAGVTVLPPSAMGGKGANVPKGAAAAAMVGRQTHAVDRSRTPQPRVAGRTPPAKPKLPKPWEEQWSEEYGIPYYWNPDTDESSWEVPAE